MKRSVSIVTILLCGVGLSAVLVGAGRQDARPAVAVQPPGNTYRAQPDTYCVTCHNQRVETAGLSLDTLDLSSVPAHAETWEKVIRKLRSRLMPPAGAPRPDATLYDGLASWLEKEIDRAAAANPNPGTKEPFHRLNRAEYQNVIRDLLDLEIDVKDLLPPDDASYGFDNIGGVLKINQPVMERYLSAARRISRIALGSIDTPATSQTVRLRPDLPQFERLEGLPSGTRGGTVIRHTFPVDADYEIKLQLGAGTAPGPRQLELNVDGERVRVFTITPPVRGRGRPPSQDPDSEAGDNASLEVRFPIKAGPREIVATFVKGTGSIEIEGSRSIFSRPGPFHEGNQLMPVTEPFLSTLTITGPFNVRGAGDTPSRRRILVCQPARSDEELDCARTILTALARRAFRRPVSEADVRPLLTFFSANREEGFDAGVELALRRLLVHPEFLFRIETPPANIAAGRTYRLGDLELASRLSFFLWSSVPDDELIELAAKRQLRNPATLERQVRRMLADPRSEAFVSNFAGQWLYLRNLEARHRQLLILRTAWLCRSPYLWAQHASVARSAGMTSGELERIARGPDASGWSPFETALLRAVDELIVDSFVSDATWSVLTARYDTRQVMDAVFTVAEFTMIAGTVNSLGVAIDEGFPDRPPDVPVVPAAARTNVRLIGKEARIAPLEPPEWPPDVKQWLARYGNRPVAAIYRTYARHLAMDQPRTRVSEHIRQDSTLSMRIRELLIIRIGVLCRSEYEWAAHAPAGRRAGMTDTDIHRLGEGPGSGGDPVENALLRAADELHRDNIVSDATWRELTAVFDAKQMLDILTTVGGYRMVSMALNTFGVQLEPGAERFPAVLR